MEIRSGTCTDYRVVLLGISCPCLVLLKHCMQYTGAEFIGILCLFRIGLYLIGSFIPGKALPQAKIHPCSKGIKSYRKGEMQWQYRIGRGLVECDHGPLPWD